MIFLAHTGGCAADQEHGCLFLFLLRDRLRQEHQNRAAGDLGLGGEIKRKTLKLREVLVVTDHRVRRRLPCSHGPAVLVHLGEAFLDAGVFVFL